MSRLRTTGAHRADHNERASVSTSAIADCSNSTIKTPVGTRENIRRGMRPPRESRPTFARMIVTAESAADQREMQWTDTAFRKSELTTESRQVLAPFRTESGKYQRRGYTGRARPRLRHRLFIARLSMTSAGESSLRP